MPVLYSVKHIYQAYGYSTELEGSLVLKSPADMSA